MFFSFRKEQDFHLFTNFEYDLKLLNYISNILIYSRNVIINRRYSGNNIMSIILMNINVS